ncbi:MAG: L-serine ammonia-lyase, iron-sulfur-dependent, subunit alpha [Acidaminococcus sp.]|jgi:L-serine dehydratase|nr:L-serine ammonia-lyase, iron-sulfur-dependent, subunit alpha [Acidaminococcus sp.]MCI2099663.1 L-serine ammonia-lyase, iron-sulfur-dependent, subunit alpha [Acidaminococcus sp.]MCI2113932.1 L-serine ammonia-lyase, iron-sulfur-dependent, subunit alpha [Acidaminococcus sp.]MCI2115831.1 L-serine ammonia-lyase, iron-sulfur-dependent, subunit alpha [Acidaminococcus sp.]
MEKLPCSIFNDVLGPVMRGPSSSHVAGAARIAALIRQSLGNDVKKVVCDFDVNGSLAASHTGHGSDMGFACGLLDIPLASPEVDRYEELLKEKNIDVEYRILDYGAVHPGNYRVSAEGKNGKKRNWEAISIGGGMVEMQKLDGFKVQIQGDFYELLVYFDLSQKALSAFQSAADRILPPYEFRLPDENGKKAIVNWKFAHPLSPELVKKISGMTGVTDCFTLDPVLPTLSSKESNVPFSSAEQLINYSKRHEPMDAWKYATLYEMRRGGKSENEVIKQMDEILSIMEKAVDTGLRGTQYRDRILGVQCSKIEEEKKRLVPDPLVNAVIAQITAVMECKSSMGVIVAAPTCGSCGCLPGTLLGMAKMLGWSRQQLIEGLFVAGLVGVFFAEQATFSAEVAGCQVECGAASGMTADAIAAIMGGSIQECLDAASVALQNITGLACDPVGNRVEVPCLGKNIMAGTNAIASANMILAGYDKVIPLDETIKAILEIGLSLPLELRCTFGGLGKTKTAREILKKTERHFLPEE